MKHRLSLMVAFSAVVGWFLLSTDISLQLLSLFIGTFLLAGGASALNQFQERHLDIKMGRTLNRPLPSKRMTPGSALNISIFMIIAGTALLLFFNSWITALLGILNVIIYNFIYTLLKTKTQYAVLPGAIVGAIPPMMGWTAAGGHLIEPQIIYFAVFMFMWQMPHFWLLVIKYGKEYEKAGFTILSGDIDEQKIKRLVFYWGAITSVYLLAFPLFFQNASVFTLVVIILLNLFFIAGFYKILYKPNEESKSTFKAFMLINSYAMLIMILFIVNTFIS